jgi:hypothetical protein
MRRTKVAEIYRKTGNLRAVQLLLGHTKVDSTVRYLGVEIEDALSIAERIDIWEFWRTVGAVRHFEAVLIVWYFLRQRWAHFTDFLFCSECRLLWSGQKRGKTGEGFAQGLCPYTF